MAYGHWRLPGLTPVLQKNFRHLYADIGWFGVLAGSTLAFLSIYAARLGAGGFQIGLLTAGPALVNLLISLPAGRLLEKLSLIRTPFWSALLQRSGYLILVLLPWLFNDQAQVAALVLITLAIAIPGTMLAISFNAMLAEVVPVDLRAEVLGKRNALLAISTTASTLASGLLLDRIDFPLNYQIVFGLGWAGAYLSSYHLSRLQPISQISAPLPSVGAFAISNSLIKFRNAFHRLARLSPRGGLGLQAIVHLDLLKGPVGRFMAAYLLFYTFQYLGIPIFPLVYVDSLQLTDGMISLGSALFYAAMFLVSLRLKKLAVRFGHHGLLATSAILLGTYPLLLGLAQGPLLYWIGSLSGGLVYGVVSASLLNRLMEVVPEGQRASGMSLHNLALNLGVLLGSLGGPVLADAVGFQESLIWVAALRFLGGIILLFWA